MACSFGRLLLGVSELRYFRICRDGFGVAVRAVRRGGDIAFFRVYRESRVVGTLPALVETVRWLRSWRSPSFVRVTGGLVDPDRLGAWLLVGFFCSSARRRDVGFHGIVSGCVVRA